MAASGRLTRAMSCNTRRWSRARLGKQRRGKVPWAFRKGIRLPRGTYEVRARTVDRTGNVERVARKQARKRFRIR
jgi:hypothetical protein